MKPKDSRFNWYIEQLIELSKNPKAEILGYKKEEFLELIDLLFGPIFDNNNKTVFIEDARYINYAIQKLAKIEKLDLYLNAQNVPPEIIQAAEDFGDEGEIEKTRLEARNKVETFIKKQEQLKVTNIAQAQEDISQKAQAMVKASLPGSLVRDAEVVKKLSQVIENELTAAYLETILPEDLSPQVLQRVTQHIIETADLPEQLIAAESSLPPNVAQLIKANLGNLSWGPETTATIKEINKTGFVLPRPLREKMPTAGGPPSIPSVIRHPQLLLQKVALFPLAKTTEVVAKASLDNEKALLQKIKRLRADLRANPQELAASEWQRYISSRFRTNNKLFSSFTGLTKADFEQFRIHLTVTCGLGPIDPSVQYVDNQIRKMAMFEQRSRLAGFYQRYLRLDREAGSIQPRLEVGQREYFLPRTKPISNFGQKAISFGEQIGYYRQFVEYPGIKVIRSIPLKKFADFRSFIARKTLQPIFARLGQTAIGQGIKSGIRGIISKGAAQGLIKAGTAFLTRLGLTKLASAIGTVIAPGIGTAIGLVVGFVIDKARDILSKFKQQITKPEFALGALGIGTLSLLAFSAPLKLIISVPAFALSVPGLIASGGGIFGSAAAVTVAVLSVFFAPFAVPIAAFVISLVIGLMALTLFIVFLTASAFIIPAQPVAEIKEAQSNYIEVSKTANPTTADAPPVEISYTIQITAKQEIITNIKVDNQTTVTNENNNFSITKDRGGNSITSFPCPDLNPGETCVKEYTIEAKGQDFENSAIFDTVIVLADVPSKNLADERSSASASVIIGTPPLRCFVFKDRDLMSRWADDEKAIEIQAISELSQYDKYIDKLCARGTIYLVRENEDYNYSGETHGDSSISLYNKNFINIGNAIFTLAHESGHIYSHRIGSDYQLFLGSGAYNKEGLICSYNLPTNSPKSESFAEMIGNYVRFSNDNCFQGQSFSQKYPLHFQFAGHIIFEDF